MEKASFKGLTCGITGAGGYLGKRLTVDLLKRDADQVHLFDVREVDFSHIPVCVQEKCQVFVGDIRKYEDVKKMAKGCDVIFHIASYGMSGREMLNKQMIWDVNVQGTKHMLTACEEFGVKGLVYTSTYNVVFCGETIDGGTAASLSPAPLSSQHDEYSKTKSVAEGMVRNSKVPTIALRSAGIYGDGEERHFPRIISYLQKGLFSFTIGGDKTLVEWVYVDNLVYAHVVGGLWLVGRGVRAEGEKGEGKRGDVVGKAFFISDWKPINQYEFLEPLVLGLGYSMPSMDVPMGLMYYFGWGVEIVHKLVRPVYNFSPLLSRAEVLKVSVTHWFKPDEARDILGYRPLVGPDVGLKRMVDHFKKKYPQKPEQSLSWLWLLCIFIVILAWLFYF